MPTAEKIANQAFLHVRLTIKLGMLVHYILSEPANTGIHIKDALRGEISAPFISIVTALASACQERQRALPPKANLRLDDLLAITTVLAQHREEASHLAAEALLLGFETRLQAWLVIAADARAQERKGICKRDPNLPRFEFLTLALQRETAVIQHIVNANRTPSNDTLLSFWNQS